MIYGQRTLNYTVFILRLQQDCLVSRLFPSYGTAYFIHNMFRSFYYYNTQSIYFLALSLKFTEAHQLASNREGTHFNFARFPFSGGNLFVGGLNGLPIFWRQIY